MSRRNSHRRQRAMNARRRAGLPEWPYRVDPFLPYIPPSHPGPLRVIHADPDTFPWYRDFGAGPVFRRMDGSAIGPVEVDAMAFADGSSMVRWEVVEVRPGEQEVVATLIPEAEWRKEPSP